MKNIFITGFMGCGKTTIGNLIKLKTNLNVIDTDAEIEKITKLKINQIFNIYGEAYFRTLETSLLRKINNQQNLIVITGGATLISNDNFKIIKNNSIVILFKTDFKICFQRIKNSKRPLVQKLNSYKQLQKLYLNRALKYDSIATYSVMEKQNLTLQHKFKITLKLIKNLSAKT